MSWVDVIDHAVSILGIVVTAALVIVTLLDSQRHLIDALVTMAKRKETPGGQHSVRTVRERCKDPHKHSGCDWPTVKRHG